MAARLRGARLSCTTENLTGLTIDHFVQVDLIGFYRISNAIGGVQVNLCAAAKEANSGIDLPKGVSTIKGKQALAFVRQRYGLPNWRPRPHQAPAVLPVRGVPQTLQRRRDAQPDQAEEPAQGSDRPR